MLDRRHAVATLLCDRPADLLVVCDDLEMGGALEGRSMSEAGIDAVRAGCDVLLVCRRAENVMNVHSTLIKVMEGDAAFRERALRAASRIENWSRSLPPAKTFGGDLDALRQALGALRGMIAARAAETTRKT